MIRSIDWLREMALSAPRPGAGDTQLLLQALRQRLARTAGDAFSDGCTARGDDPATQIRATVLECVADLSHLQRMMGDEAGAAPAGTQAGARETRRRALHDGPALRPIAEFLRTRLGRARP